ncbi:hypothetical protein D3C81_1375600 [compost metagenome]
MADPCEARRASEIINAAGINGRPMVVRTSANALPTPDSTSTLPNTPPAPVTRITTAAVGSAPPITSLVCCRLQPRRMARK